MATSAENPFPSSSVEGSAPSRAGASGSNGPSTSVPGSSLGSSAGVGGAGSSTTGSTPPSSGAPSSPGATTGSMGSGASGSGASGTGSRDWNRKDDDMFNRVVKGAHETIDRLADSAAPHVHRIQDTVTSRAGQAREVSDEWTQSLRTTVRDNPLAAVATALAVGVLIARLTR